MSSVKQVPSNLFHKNYLWRDADYDAMNMYLNTVDWSNVICLNPCAEQMWDAFITLLWNATDMFVPSRNVRVNNNTGHTSRALPRKLRKCMADKRKIWSQLKSCPNDLQLRGKYRELVCYWRKLVRERDMCEEERIIEADSLGQFYRFINKRISNKSSVGAIVGNCGKVYTENIDKANAFNKYFASVVSLMMELLHMLTLSFLIPFLIPLVSAITTCLTLFANSSANCHQGQMVFLLC